MAVRRNLCPRPALKTSTGAPWFGPSGWARTTTAHATLPRTTAFAGSTAGGVATPRWSCTAGLNYVGSLSVRFTAASTGNIGIDWYTTAGVYLSTSNGPTFDQTGGTTARLNTGVGLAPPDAVEGLVVVLGFDGAAELTAVLVEQTSTVGGAYFDGDSANSAWDGTNGESSSTETTAAPVVLTGALPALGGALTGIRESYGVLTGTLPALAGAIGLVIQVSYDRRLGRIRVSAQGLVAGVIRAVVYSRPAGAARWSEVRGGRVAVVTGRFVRTVDDYEYVAGAAMEYRVIGYSSPENVFPEVVAQTETVLVEDTTDNTVWIKFVPMPASNQRVALRGWSEMGRRSRNAVYPVPGRRDPVVITDVHTSRTVTVELLTFTHDERDALDAALAQGAPAFLQTPQDCGLPSMYVAVGDYTWEPGIAARTTFTVPLTEVTAPPLSVVGAGSTWQTILDQNATWADVAAKYSSWAAVAA